METWKIGVIVFLIGALGGYGAYQSQKPSLPPPPTPEEIQQAPKRTYPIHTFVNQPVPQWKIADQSKWLNTARPLSSADFKGHVTVLEFFRIDCSHCQEAAPFMKYLHETYGPKGLKVVAVHSPVTPREKDWKVVQQQIKDWGLKYPIASDDAQKVFLGPFKGTNFPSTLLIDKNGVVRSVETGFDTAKAETLETEIKKLLGTGAQASSNAVPTAPGRP